MSMADKEIDSLSDMLGDVIQESNKWEKAFNIVMEYSEDLPDCDNEEIEKRLKAIGVLQ